MRKALPILLIVVTLCGAVGLVAGIWTILSLRHTARTAGPYVMIESPDQGTTLGVGADVLVHAYGRDPDGVTRIELWADGVLTAVEESSSSEGSTPLPLLADWAPEAAGPHLLLVRAFDRHGDLGQVAVGVLAEEREAPAVYRMQDGLGDVPEDLWAAAAQDPASLEAAVATGEIPLEAVTPMSDEEGGEASPPPPPPEDSGGGGGPSLASPSFSPAVMGLGSLLDIPHGPTEQWLEVEAMSLEVDKDYDGVYCYINPRGGETPSRVPSEGYFDTQGERAWNIAAYLGGANRMTVPWPTVYGEKLLVFIRCIGIQHTSQGDRGYELGGGWTYHYPPEFDGREQQRWFTDRGGGFHVVYTIRWGAGAIADPLSAPSGLASRCWENEFLGSLFCQLYWNYPESVEHQINGFVLLRDGEFAYDVRDPSSRAILLGQAELPPCGGDGAATYQVAAYRDDPFLPGNLGALSNPLTLENPACQTRYAVVRFLEMPVVIVAGDCHTVECTQGLDNHDCAEDGFGYLIANDQILAMGSDPDGGFGWLIDFDCPVQRGGEPYRISDLTGPGHQDAVLVELNPYERLVVWLKIYDWDYYADDRECVGSYELTPQQLDEIEQSGGSHHYHLDAEEGGGRCELHFTVQVFSSITGPSEAP